MQKVTDLYPPEIARHKLQNHFAGNTVMLELIQKLNKTSLCTFAALCDGNVVTTSGYNRGLTLSGTKTHVKGFWS
ncbi:hypothetical protein EVY01_04595 [Escherichia coli]|uniref:hypothetical protein n=1 Tax=Escherichia coli TaxID=562 RepID=UPI001021FCCF|nr:hypothetical protein [Escherichia coli]RZB11361.1 hypothetical protein EVY01_04595 [Escherichia coli]